MDDDRNYYNNGNGGILGNMFGRNCGNNTEILFFIIIFLLLFTSYGNGYNN